VKVAALIKERTGYSVSPDAMFDIQVWYFFFFLIFFYMKMLVVSKLLERRGKCCFRELGLEMSRAESNPDSARLDKN